MPEPAPPAQTGPGQDELSSRDISPSGEPPQVAPAQGISGSAAPPQQEQPPMATEPPQAPPQTCLEEWSQPIDSHENDAVERLRRRVRRRHLERHHRRPLSQGGGQHWRRRRGCPFTPLKGKVVPACATATCGAFDATSGRMVHPRTVLPWEGLQCGAEDADIHLLIALTPDHRRVGGLTIPHQWHMRSRPRDPDAASKPASV